MGHISANYPDEERTQVYTDGSATEAIKDGGGGSTSNQKCTSCGSWEYATNCRAEAMALNTAATEILANLDKTHKKVVFFSDALSVLDAPQNP